MVGKFTDRDYLRGDQYKDAVKLNSRIALHQRFSTNPGWLLWVFDRLSSALPPKCRILEVGCGPGTLWAENLPHVPAGWNVTLSDFSPGMVRQSIETLHGAPPPFAFVNLDTQCIPFADAQFDAVVANHMLYHVPDLPQALGEIRRVLRPGGRIFAATNGRDHMRELSELTHRFGGPMWAFRSNLGFRLENGEEMLAPYFEHTALHRYEDGLTVTEVEPLLAYVFSSITAAFTEAQEAAFAEYVAGQIEANGAIHITKSTGLVEGRRI